MKKLQLFLFLMLLNLNCLLAGGELGTVNTYVTEDTEVANIIQVTPLEMPKILEPIVIAPVDVSPIYVGLGLVAARYNSKCLDGTSGCDGIDTSVGLLGKVGYDFDKYIGLEVRALITPIGSNGAEVQHVGGFLKPMYPVYSELNAYGLVGVGSTKTKGSLKKANVSGLSFGAGIEYDLSEDTKKLDGMSEQEKGFGVFADYVRLYYKKNSPDLDAVSVGVTYDF